MSAIYFLIVVFLLGLAIFDLFVGVSNDAVNFLQSAVGARVAKFRTILLVASLGVILGAAISSGMMDVARHGMMMPQYFSFENVMTLFLAVMVTDIIILDVFNTLGMPTSTTVSLVFGSRKRKKMGWQSFLTRAKTVLHDQYFVHAPVIRLQLQIERVNLVLLLAVLLKNHETDGIDEEKGRHADIKAVADG